MSLLPKLKRARSYVAINTRVLLNPDGDDYTKGNLGKK